MPTTSRVLHSPRAHLQISPPRLCGGAGARHSRQHLHDRHLCSVRTQVDEANSDILLVGDSVAMVVHGHDTTLPVTVEEMLVHCRWAAWWDKGGRLDGLQCWWVCARFS